MIKLFTGLPGAGKTYRAVYELRGACKDYYVLHNIDGLKEDSFEGGKYISKFPSDDKSFREFFSIENQKKLHIEAKEKYGRPLLIIIDECQIYLGKVNEGIKAWLSYHRHLGQDVWLITQDKYNIAREYNNLVEVEIQGKRGYVFKSFIYSYFVKGERVKTDKLPKEIDVFSLYQSMSMQEVKKPKSKLVMFALIFAGIAAGFGVFYVFVQMPKTFVDKKEKKPVSVERKSQDVFNKNAFVPAGDLQVNKYSYVGMLGNTAMFVDSGLNLWREDQIYDGVTVVKDRGSMSAVYIDKQKGPENLKLGSIRFNNSAASGARSATSGGAVSAGAAVDQHVGNKWVKVIVDIR